jgi:endonuclease YncB( thermonuclease family)
MDGADHLGEPVRTRAFLAAALLILFAGPPAAAEQIVSPPSRDVTPPGFTPGPKVTTPLFRDDIPPPPPEAPRWHRFFLPVTTDSGTFQVKGLVIRIAGLAPPAPDTTCPAADNRSWPCGRTALYSFRMFLRGRAVECYYATSGKPEIAAPCRVGATDLGLWLLSQGWADAATNASDTYHAAETAARCARLGIWRGRVRDAGCPE